MPHKPKRVNTKNVLANHLGWDASELIEYRYHYGRTSVPVYSIGDQYYCCVRSGKPATHRDADYRWEWNKVEDRYAEANDCEIYVSK